MAGRRLFPALGWLLLRRSRPSPRVVAAGVAASGVCAYGFWAQFSRGHAPSHRLPVVLYAAAVPSSPDATAGKAQTDQLRSRQRRFLDFASIVYKDEVYMTPQDFLLSVTHEEARERNFRVEVNEATVDAWLKKTPAKNKDVNEKLFRLVGDHGLISFVEYLFLLCILTEPGSRFELAFNMFDLDGNKLVDRDEFGVLAKIFAVPQLLSRSIEDAVTQQNSDSLGQSAEQPVPASTSVRLPASKKELTQVSPTTTLTTHFFGIKGKEVLGYDEFARFSSGLQREVLVVEFHEFSHGLPSISELDFARILLRYTKLPAAKLEECLERVRRKAADPRQADDRKGIKLSDFQQFCLFLNHLDDFILMMRLYNLTNRSISVDEFQRAVNICTGSQVSKHVIETVFAIFDVDGDGHLSQSEFISIMKSRLKRGLRSHLKSHKKSSLDNFKRCLKQEIANA